MAEGPLVYVASTLAHHLRVLTLRVLLRSYVLTVLRVYIFIGADVSLDYRRLSILAQTKAFHPPRGHPSLLLWYSALHSYSYVSGFSRA